MNLPNGDKIRVSLNEALSAFKETQNRRQELVKLYSKRFAPDPKEEAGRRAEYEARRRLQAQLSGTGWSIHSFLRVPDWRLKRRMEIDFVITSPVEAIILELKNWIGAVSLSGQDVIQIRRYGPESTNHGPIFDDLEKKVAGLLSYHMRRGRQSVTARRYVVFYNPRLLVSAEIRKRDDVISYAELVQKIPRERRLRNGDLKGLERILEAIMYELGYRGSNSPSAAKPTNEIRGLRDSLDELGSWDILEVFGGKVIFGDILGGDGGFKIGDREATERSTIKSIEVSTDRSPVLALLREPKAKATIVYRDGTTSSGPCLRDMVVKYQRAGSKDSETLHLYHLTRLEFGYTQRPNFKLDWSDVRVGMQYDGIIKKIIPFRIFVAIGAPVDATLQLSNASPVGNVERREGDQITVRVVSVSIARERIEVDLA